MEGYESHAIMNAWPWSWSVRTSAYLQCERWGIPDAELLAFLGCADFWEAASRYDLDPELQRRFVLLSGEHGLTVFKAWGGIAWPEMNSMNCVSKLTHWCVNGPVGGAGLRAYPHSVDVQTKLT